MNWVGVAVFSLVALLVGMPLWGWLRAKKSVGQRAPDTSAIDSTAATDARRVYYFHSRHCGPCRAIAPLVAKLRGSHRNLIDVDIERNIELARAFSIAGTPSFVLVENGQIKRVLLGGQTEKTLVGLLKNP